jgi:hypothetical protein
MTPQFWVQKLLHWLDAWKFEAVIMGTLLVLGLFVVAMVWDPEAVSGMLAAVVYFSPLWLPIFLFVGFWTTWIHYVRFYFWFGLKHVVLQIEVPPEVTKSPLSMELFLVNLWNSGGEATFIARMWKGSFRAIWSLEIASNEGQIHYYLHTREVWRDIVEARLYGQFPEAKVTVLDQDYVTKVPFNLEEYDLVGGEMSKDGSVPQVYPIKTYVDWALDKDPDKPEKQVDPLTHIFELLGTMGKDEYLWMQIIAKARKKDEWYGFYREGWFAKNDYADGAKKALKELTKGAIERAGEFTEDPAEKKKVGARGSMLLSPVEREKVEVIERNLGKLIFECGIRVLYIAKRTRFKGINGGAVVHFFRPFEKTGYNKLGPSGSGRGTLYFDYPWQDWNNWRANTEKRNQFFRYKHRAYFYVPYDQVPVMMTTEELASLWHFPSSAVKTPALSRVPSRRAEAPSNLPTGPVPADLPL